MKKLIASFGLLVGLWAPAVSAHPAVGGDVPPANFTTIGGRDWVWASPCEGNGSGCAEAVTLHDNWRFPTTFEYDNFMEPARAFLAANSLCGSPWFQHNHAHCDFGDPMWRNDNPATNGTFFDTLLVRNGALAVPEPGTLALIGLGLVGIAVRRKTLSA